MTRIIAGDAGGVRLSVPGTGTRPTSDRVRESLFGALESADAVRGARVLDLYAGSGALGLEALSRGASSADLVERSRPAAAVLRRNAAAVAQTTSAPAARVHETAVRSFLQRTAGPWDLVFTDPPYDLDDAALAADLAALSPLLSASALVVIERSRRSAVPDVAGAALELVREKTYGDTAVWWAAPREPDAAEPTQPDAESQSR